MPTSTPTSTSTETVTELLFHLVRMPTVAQDHATNRAALDWVEEQLRDLPLTFKRYTSNGFPSLVATTTGVKNPKHPKLWLAAHMDVVPGSNKLFQPQIKDDYVTGRGVRDMKFAIAAYIRVLQDLGNTLGNYDLGLMITTDEENSGLNGVGYLLGEQKYRGDIALLPDGGDNWKLESHAKGLMRIEVEARGKAGHGSRPWLGHSAIHELLGYLHEVESNFPREPCNDHTHMHNTLNIGQINGGQAVNQLADHATASLDIRTAPESRTTTILEMLEKAQLKYPDITLHRIFVNDSYMQPIDGAAKLWREISEEVTGLDLSKTVYAHAGSDARYFAKHNIPCIITYPRGDGQHSEHERVLLKDLDNFYEVTRRFVGAWAKVSERA